MATIVDFYNTDDDAGAGCGQTRWIAMTFTASKDYDISSVRVKVHKLGTPVGTATLAVRATASSKPTGPDLAFGTFDGDALGASPGEWIEIALNTPVSLTMGVMYALVMRAPSAGATNYCVWRDDITSPLYPGGTYNYSTNNGSTWTIFSTADFMFETYEAGGAEVELDFVLVGTGTFTTTLESTETTDVVAVPQAVETPVVEHLQFKTSILRGIDGSEQRIPLRKVPRRVLEMRIIDRLQLMDSILFSQAGAELSVPRWYEPAYLSAAASIGSSTIDVNTTALSEFVAGEYLMVSLSSYVFDVVEIDTVNPTDIVLANVLTHSYPVGAQVVPVSRAYVEGPVQVTKRMGEGKFDAKLVEFPIDNDLGLTPYAPHELTIDDVNYSDSGQARQSIRVQAYRTDGNYGLFEVVALRDGSDKGFTLGFRTHSRQELWDLRELIYKLQGRAVSFYLTTSDQDLTLADDLTISQTLMDVENCGYSSYVNEEHTIRVVMKDGSTLTRTITSWSVLSDTVERLVVNSAWPASVDKKDVDRIEFIELVRLDTDDVTIRHFSAIGDASCDVPVVRCVDATEWVFPDGFVDGATSWDDETNVYDGNSDTAATTTVAATSWSQLLELTFSRNVLATKVRINAGLDGPSGIDECKVELYYDDGWQSFYSNDTYPDNAWFEIDLDEEKEVSSARVSFYNADSGNQDAYLYGFQLRGILL